MPTVTTSQIKFPDDLHPIGTKVYLPRPSTRQVVADEVIGYFGQVVKDDKDLLFIPSDYQLNAANLERGTDDYTGWKADEFFLSYDEALAMARVYPVDVTADIANEAIGYTDDADGYGVEHPDETELGNCCAAVDHVRWILARAIHQGYITAVARRDLGKIIETHDPPEKRVLLNQILSQIDLKW